MPTEELYNSFAEGDVRRDVTIMKDFTYSDGSTLVFAESARYPYYFCKYWDREAEPMGQNSEQNYPYMRYSEVLLMYAEALNEVNEARRPRLTRRSTRCATAPSRTTVRVNTT